jgi:pimeloyl-ACP methyl ester carboxylesterase
MESHLLPYKNSHVHYLKFGRGTRFLFCFHGYGENAHSFRMLENSLGHDYTFISIDLPFHGNTEWKEGLELTPSDLHHIINAIVPLELQTVSLIGYSMGGRISLTLLQEIPSRIERVVLIAPDGLHKNFWYWLSTQTGMGNKLFSYTMKHPRWFFGGMKLLRGLNLLNKSIFKFAHAYLDDKTERDMLYKRWTTMRKFRPRSPLITKAVAEYNIPVRMLFGNYDRIILSKRSTGLDKNNDTIIIRTIRAGHQLLKEKYANEIAALFYE